MNLKIKKLYEDSIIPTRAYETDAGLDLYAYITEEWCKNYASSYVIYGNKSSVRIPALSKATIPTGIAIQLPHYNLYRVNVADNVMVHYQAEIRSRSGLAANSGLFVLNSPGTIDPSYVGELKVILFNTTDDDILIKHNQKIAQLVITPFVIPDLDVVLELSETNRGSNGFGSSGV